MQETDQEKLELMLPHLYGHKLYQWQHDFITSTNKTNILCAANQIGKSTANILRLIYHCTDRTWWKVLWPHFNVPNQMWYLYPSQDVATQEFETKWVPQYMPRGAAEKDATYGWKAHYNRSLLDYIQWNNGPRTIFKTYSQKAAHLQSGTVFEIFADEELPTGIYDELMFRLTATDGYFNLVFTATLGQEFWRRAIMERGGHNETLKSAFKQKISMYDCMKFKDGTRSHWTHEKINNIKAKCKDEAEVRRRVYGDFILASGLKYPQFNPEKHMVEETKVDPSWHVYSGVDIGSGGSAGHPGAYVFIAVSPDFTQGRVFLGKRLDGIQTTAADILKYYLEDVATNNLKPVSQVYDFMAKDFGVIAERSGINFEKANKAHDIGEDTLNSLWKNDALLIHDTPELNKLSIEIQSLYADTDKRKAVDDITDALRYAAVSVPWDWGKIRENRYPELFKRKIKKISETERRKRWFRGEDDRKENPKDVQEEIDFWNDELDQFG